MLIATITALAILFGGGTFETFFIDDLRKGVKEYVVDDERKDEILDDLKRSEKMIKSFNKERKAQFKEFKKLNRSRATGSEELTGFFEKSMTTRGEYQHHLINERLTVSAKITPDEWSAIIDNSGHATDKRMQKAQKKLDKAESRGERPFDKTREVITEAVADSDTQQLLQGRLDAMLRSFEKLDSELSAVNVNESALLVDRDISRHQMQQVAEQMNEVRLAVFRHLVDFHMAVKEHTDATEWDQVMKQFNKDISLSAH
jgi:hypothetical protein